MTVAWGADSGADAELIQGNYSSRRDDMRREKITALAQSHFFQVILAERSYKYSKMALRWALGALDSWSV